VMAALGHRTFQILAHPTAGNVALLGACVLAWIAASFGVQLLVSKLRSPDS